MTHTPGIPLDTDTHFHHHAVMESTKAAISWSAIIGGAAIATVITLLMMVLGSGLGLASMSPWSGQGMSAHHIGLAAVVWLILTQWIASGLGGYLTGRLRTKWHGVHSHEVFFRDTAHGFLSWTLTTLLMVGVLANVVAGLAGDAAKVAGGATMAASAGAGYQAAQGEQRQARSGYSINDYMIDSLFRPDTQASATVTTPATSPQEINLEAMHVLATDLKDDNVSDADRTYLAQLVSERNGMSQADALNRVNTVIAQLQDAKTKAMQEADKARKAASKFTVMTFLSMLIGAFIASSAAALGGFERDSLTIGDTDLPNRRIL